MAEEEREQEDNNKRIRPQGQARGQKKTFFFITSVTNQKQGLYIFCVKVFGNYQERFCNQVWDQ